MASGKVAAKGILLAALGLWSAGSVGNGIVRERMEAIDLDFPVSALGVILSADTAVSSFYRERDYTLAWSRDVDREGLLSAIKTSARHGLSPADYHDSRLSRYDTSDLDQLDSDTRASLDLLMTESALKLASHLLDGKVNPETLKTGDFANRHQRRTDDILTRILADGEVAEELDRLAPSQPGYRQLMDARSRINRLFGTLWEPIPAGTTIRPDNTDPRLPSIRQRLITLGDLTNPENAEQQGLEAYYDGELVTAVKRFQARHGLDNDGLIGQDTMAMLNLPPTERLSRIDATLERWRWLPDDLGDTYIVVNIAGFELRLVKDNADVLTTRVIVGRPSRQTPVIRDRIRHLVFNPNWTVPRTIMIEDQLPVIRQNPDYLNAMDISVYRGWGPDREPVDPDTVDWSTLHENYFPFQLVQEPGPRNALGQVKFMFPNQFDVYLHDTPARGLFSRSQRSLSSGCIRVEDAFGLATALLANANGWTRERIREIVESRSLTTVHLDKPVPIHLEYWTAWVDGSGTLQMRNDLYNHNPQLTLALETPLESGLMIRQASAD
ncbi:murein L,D-transpeptidase [Marinobacter sp.]|uniref:murein L,D-transpeptidase n=1 Tax=Marinobacter sp. TaxID=50741 RepID=UPI0034A24B3E